MAFCLLILNLILKSLYYSILGLSLRKQAWIKVVVVVRNVTLFDLVDNYQVAIRTLI